MSTVDTPDYQRGVVSAQVLLGSFPAGQQSATVGVPVNCETMIITITQELAPNEIIVTGVTTGLTYSPIAANNPAVAGPSSTWFVDVSSVLDGEVDITILESTVNPWYVYSDSAAHIVALASQRAVILTPTSSSPTASGTIVAAPPAGERLRLYTAQMSCVTAGVFGGIIDTHTGVALCSCAGPGNSGVSFLPDGLPISAASAIGYSLEAGAGAMNINLTVAIETF